MSAQRRSHLAGTALIQDRYSLLDFADYCKAMSKFMGIQWSDDTKRSSRLAEDLALDSLEAFEFVIGTEALSEVIWSPIEQPAIVTIGDAYDYYVALIKSDVELS